MAVIQPVSDVIRGHGINLHFSPEGVALLTRGWRRRFRRRWPAMRRSPPWASPMADAIWS